MYDLSAQLKYREQIRKKTDEEIKMRFLRFPRMTMANPQTRRKNTTISFKIEIKLQNLTISLLLRIFRTAKKTENNICNK